MYMYIDQSRHHEGIGSIDFTICLSLIVVWSDLNNPMALNQDIYVLLQRVTYRIDQSAGMMVNYLYDSDQIVSNHEAYVGEGNVVASSAVSRLAKGAD